jgi:hypothetical protein
MSIDPKIRILLHTAAGALIVLVALLSEYLPDSAAGWGSAQWFVAAAGAAVVGFGLLPDMGVVTRIAANACLVFLNVSLIVAFCEVGFRAVDFDFAKEQQGFERLAVFYRQPRVPTGKVFFRRPGPQEWNGQVLNFEALRRKLAPNPYIDEPEISVQYNDIGFRNPPGFRDWEIAVAGDSFTELGYLPYDDLFTTILADVLDRRVLNLGTSYTGPLTHLSYLGDYGISESTEHAVIVFYEGNDLNDLNREYSDLMRWNDTGERPYRDFQKQTSLVLTVVERARGYLERRGSHNPVDAHFISRAGDIPITLSNAPPGSADLGDETRAQLEYFLAEYERLGRQHGITPWLAYMPVKRRVLHGQLSFNENTPDAIRNWQPTDLPEFIFELAAGHGIRWIDLTPILVEKTKEQRSLHYNSIWDGHLNSIGSRVVALEIAEHFEAAFAKGVTGAGS